MPEAESNWVLEGKGAIEKLLEVIFGSLDLEEIFVSKESLEQE